MLKSTYCAAMKIGFCIPVSRIAVLVNKGKRTTGACSLPAQLKIMSYAFSGRPCLKILRQQLKKEDT